MPKILQVLETVICAIVFVFLFRHFYINFFKKVKEDINASFRNQKITISFKSKGFIPGLETDIDGVIIGGDKEKIIDGAYYKWKESLCTSMRIDEYTNDETLHIDFSKVPETINSIMIIFKVYQGMPGKDFTGLIDPKIILSDNESELATFKVDDDICEYPAVLFGCFVRQIENWKFIASGKGIDFKNAILENPKMINFSRIEWNAR